MTPPTRRSHSRIGATSVNVKIYQGGQTGVDRGAFYGALAAGWPVGGVAPRDGCDELGIIPPEVMQHMRLCSIEGMRARTEVNIENSRAVLCVVPDRTDPYATPGTALTLKYARRRAVPSLVAEAEDVDRVATWLLDRQRATTLDGKFRLMVAGPRASMWPEGQALTTSMIVRLAVIVRGWAT